MKSDSSHKEPIVVKEGHRESKPTPQRQRKHPKRNKGVSQGKEAKPTTTPDSLTHTEKHP